MVEGRGEVNREMRKSECDERKNTHTRTLWGNEFSVFVGQVQQDATRLEDAHGLSLRPLAVDDRRDFAVWVYFHEAGAKLQR